MPDKKSLDKDITFLAEAIGKDELINEFENWLDSSDLAEFVDHVKTCWDVKIPED